MPNFSGGESRAFAMGLEVENELPIGSLQSIAEQTTGWRSSASLLPAHRESERSTDRLEEFTQAANRLKEKLAEFDDILPLAFDAYFRGDKATKRSLAENIFPQDAINNIHTALARMPKYSGTPITEDEMVALDTVIGSTDKDLDAVRSNPIPKPVRPVVLKQNPSGRWSTGDAFFDAVMDIESRGDANAVSPTGATGLYQFTRGTGEQYGLIKRDSTGNIIVDNRKDPVANFEAFKKLTADNAKSLKRAGLDVTPSTLYLAHQQGAAGAKAILTAIKNGTDVPDNIRKNMNLNNGRGKTPAQFFDMFSNKIEERMGGATRQIAQSGNDGLPNTASPSLVDDLMASIPTVASAEIAQVSGDLMTQTGLGDIADGLVDSYGRLSGAADWTAILDRAFRTETPKEVPKVVSQAIKGIVGSL